MICESKEDWLKGFLTLEYGVPSADTFKRVLSRISPEQFEASFVSWTKLVAEVCSGETLPLMVNVYGGLMTTLAAKAQYTWFLLGLMMLEWCLLRSK